MKKQTFIAMFIGLAAMSLLAIQPCSAGTLSYSYVYYKAASPPLSATRYPSRSNAGTLVPFGNCSKVTGMLSAPLDVSIIPCAHPSNGTSTTFTLGYVTVSGNVGGTITIFADAQGNLPTDYVQVVPYGTNNSVVQYVYFPFGAGGGHCGTPPCPTGATIDEWYEDSQQLGDDLFVNVVAPSFNPGMPEVAGLGNYKNSGNYNGFVDTTNNAALIQAYWSVPGNIPSSNFTGRLFDRWVIVGPTNGGAMLGAGSVENLIVNRQTNVYALAFYHALCPSGYSWVSGQISQCRLNPTSTAPVANGGGVCVGGSAVCNCGRNGFPPCPPKQSTHENQQSPDVTEPIQTGPHN